MIDALEKYRERYKLVRQRLRAGGPMPIVTIRRVDHSKVKVEKLPPVTVKITELLTPFGKARLRYRMLRKAMPAMPRAARRIIIRALWDHEVTWEQVAGRGRRPFLMAPRREIYWRLKNELGLSFPRIGRLMGGRDHTTVLHHVKKHQASLEV